MLARKRGFVIRPSFYRFADMASTNPQAARPSVAVPEVLFLLAEGLARGCPTREPRDLGCLFDFGRRRGGGKRPLERR